MPVLTKDQVLEAALELDEQEREEVIARLEAQLYPSSPVSEKHKQIIRDEIAAHRRDPSTSISRDELMKGMERVVKGLSLPKRTAPVGLMAKLKQVRIDAPEDFASNLDQYASGEKRVP